MSTKAVQITNSMVNEEKEKKSEVSFMRRFMDSLTEVITVYGPGISQMLGSDYNPIR